MFQVTMDLQSQLYDLEQAMRRLVKWRDETLRQAERIIRDTNKDFDKEVLPLGREINELRERLGIAEPTAAKVKPERPARTRRRKQVDMTGLDDADRKHMEELLAKKRGK